MKKYFCSTLMILLLGAVCLRAASLAEANGLFDAGDYESAAQMYNELIEGGTVGAEIYFNLAIALERSGKTVDAILNYERALMLDPGLRVAHNNLALLAAKQGIELPPPSWVDAVTAWVHPSILLNFGSILGWVGLLGVVWCVFGNQKSQTPLAAVAGILVFLGGAMVAIGWVADPRISSAGLAIITGGEATEVRGAPATNSERLASLPAGSPVEVISPRGAWTFVGLANGKTGWVPTEVLTMVDPGQEI